MLGLGFMLMGENSAVVTHGLKDKLAEVQKTLPKDVVVEVLYDRTELVDNVIETVKHNLLAGALTPLRSAYPIYRNRMRLDSLRLGVERLIANVLRAAFRRTVSPSQSSTTVLKSDRLSRGPWSIEVSKIRRSTSPALHARP